MGSSTAKTPKLLFNAIQVALWPPSAANIKGVASCKFPASTWRCHLSTKCSSGLPGSVALFNMLIDRPCRSTKKPGLGSTSQQHLGSTQMTCQKPWRIQPNIPPKLPGLLQLPGVKLLPFSDFVQRQKRCLSSLASDKRLDWQIGYSLDIFLLTGNWYSCLSFETEVFKHSQSLQKSLEGAKDRMLPKSDKHFALPMYARHTQLRLPSSKSNHPLELKIYYLPNVTMKF